MHVEVRLVENEFALTGFRDDRNRIEVSARNSAAEVTGSTQLPATRDLEQASCSTAHDMPSEASQVDLPQIARQGKGGKRGHCAYACHEMVRFVEGLVPMVRSLWTVRTRKLRKQRAVSGDRFVQMCVDLSTLRWSWNDYILIHEIVSEPVGLDVDKDEPRAETSQGRLLWAIVLDYASPRGSRMRLRLSFTQEEMCVAGHAPQPQWLPL